MYVWWSLLTLVRLAGFGGIFYALAAASYEIKYSAYIFLTFIHCIHVHVAIWVSNNTNILSFSLSLSLPFFIR